MVYLANHSGGTVRASVMARALGIPQNYLSKTLNGLVRTGVLSGVRGPTGGFRLARDPQRVTVLSVVEPFDALTRERQCLLGLPQCTDRNACAAHEAWKRTSEQVARFFRSTTVADLMTAAPAGGSAIPPARRSR